MERITVYYTNGNPHVQIELPDEATGWKLVESAYAGLTKRKFDSVEAGIRYIIKHSASSPDLTTGIASFDINPYVAEFTVRDRLSVGFRVRVIHADRVKNIALQTAGLFTTLANEEICEVIVEEAPPAIARYIVGS